MTLKFCSQCQTEKHITQFHIRNDTRSGIRSNCKECVRKGNLSRYHGDPESKRVSHHRAWVHSLNKFYGITEEDYYRMYEEQQGCCAICGEKETNRKLSVDHCHNTKAVRGLLCNACNKGLGLFEDSPIRLNSAIIYLMERV